MKRHSLLLLICLATTPCITHTAHRLVKKVNPLLQRVIYRTNQGSNQRHFASSPYPPYKIIDFLKKQEEALANLTKGLVHDRTKLGDADNRLKKAECDRNKSTTEYESAKKALEIAQNETLASMSDSAEKQYNIAFDQQVLIIQLRSLQLAEIVKKLNTQEKPNK